MLTILHLPSLILTLLLSILHTAVPTSATPFSLSFFPRGAVHCANSPKTVAGTPAPALTLRTLPLLSALSARAPVTIWCAPQSSTYLTISLQSPQPRGSASLGLALQTAYLTISKEHLSPPNPSASFVPGTGYSFNTDWTLHVENANNHQLTWGVLAAALGALRDYVVTQNGGGPGTFEIFDGENQVGKGTIGFGTGAAV